MPGALLLAVGLQLIHVAVVFYFAPKLERRPSSMAFSESRRYAVWLYVVARLATAAAVLNATMLGAALREERVAAVDDDRLAADHPRGG